MSGATWLDQPGQGGQAAAPAATTAAASGHVLPRYAQFLPPLFRVINMGLSVMMGASAVNGILKITDWALADFFVALYMLIFAAILFLFELSQFKYIALIDAVFKRNFGFLYGSRGKALYIIFIAFLNFGLVSTGKLQLASGILLAIDGGLMLLLTFRYPTLFAANTAGGGDSGAAPAKGPGQV